MTVITLISEVFNEPASSLTDDKRLMSMAEWDSMNHMLFITKLEESFQVQLDGDEIASIETIGDIKRILNEKGVLEK